MKINEKNFLIVLLYSATFEMKKEKEKLPYIFHAFSQEPNGGLVAVTLFFNISLYLDLKPSFYTFLCFFSGIKVGRSESLKEVSVYVSHLKSLVSFDNCLSLPSFFFPVTGFCVLCFIDCRFEFIQM